MSDNIAKVLIGCKSDLAHKREVSYEEGCQMAKMYSMEYIEVSSKTGENVHEAMQIIIGQIA